MDELKREIEAVSIEADRQESAFLQQIILWDIMSLTDPGRELNDEYQTLTRLQAEVRYSDEIYRLLYKKGSLFQGEGLQDLKKEYRGLLASLVRQVLDLIEDHHAKIRSKAPRFAFNVDPAIYDDMFYHKVTSRDDDVQAAVELLARASKAEDESDGEENETDEEGRGANTKQARAAVGASTTKRPQPGGSPRGTQGRHTPGSPKPKLFPDQKTYQLSRTASKGWHVVAPSGFSSQVPALTSPVLRKRTHFYQNPNVLGSMETGKTIRDVADEDDVDEEELEASTSASDPMRRRIQGVDPIFVSHFGPETRPPASHIKADAQSTKPVPSVAPEPQPGAVPQPYSRPNVLAYVKGTIPRAKSVRPLRPSEMAALAEAANKQQQQQQQQQRQSLTPPKARPASPDVSKASASGASTSRSRSRSKSASPRAQGEGEAAAAAAAPAAAPDAPPPVLLSAPPEMKTRPTVTFNTEEEAPSIPPQEASSSSSTAATRARAAVKFKDEGENEISIKVPGHGKARASFINIDIESLDKGPNYGRIRDFPVLVPSILNSDVGLTFPENTDLFSPLDEADEAEENP